ncbi:EAL domain-containing protein [Roseovarius salinarum]|uniref:EAL domain-containing protein n=1 Tax=Roseovarius salinarum TaxID=1981892 RepID=UPI000C34F095|nr:EAL domain-containing protein [Roseovarius salinarum]
MAAGNRAKWADVPPGQEDPLSYAVAARDASALDMVRRAVAARKVMLAYQPVMPAAHPERPGFYEGLIRILDDTGRVIPARDFIHAVEETETGREIDCIALRKGLQALHAHPGLRLSINMSARSIGYRRWMRTLLRGLDRDPTIAERLILEITEASAMRVPELVTGFMADLQHRGISFALDDFGAGYTSFRYLKDFYFDIIKIDGQFIRGISGDPDNQVLTAALISIARHFDMVSIAESVETAADAAFLTRQGIDCMQGYFFAAPTVRPPWQSPAPRAASA